MAPSLNRKNPKYLDVFVDCCIHLIYQPSDVGDFPWIIPHQLNNSGLTKQREV